MKHRRIALGAALALTMIAARARAQGAPPRAAPAAAAPATASGAPSAKAPAAPAEPAAPTPAFLETHGKRETPPPDEADLFTPPPPEAQAPSVAVPPPRPAADDTRPWWDHAAVWVGAGIALAGAAAVVLLARPDRDPTCGTVGPCASRVP